MKNFTRVSEPHAGLSKISSAVRATIFGLGCIQGMSHAATIEVNSNLDNGADCTLRDAVVSVNEGILQPECSIISGTLGSADRITFSSALNENTVRLTTGLRITSDVNIDANGVNNLTIVRESDGGSIISVGDSKVSLNNLTLKGAASLYYAGAIFVDDGGGA